MPPDRRGLKPAPTTPAPTKAPHSRDLRKGRFSQAGGVYLLTWATEQRMPWFSDWTLGRLVVGSLRRAHGNGDAESLAFVVMPDHVHWLAVLCRRGLGDLLRDVKSHSGYSVKQALRRRPGREPKTIWQEGYHDHALRQEEDVLAVARYIVANPVRAGLVKSVRDYPLWDAKWL